MPVQTATTIDQASADRLSADFHRCFSDFEARDDLFAPDTFFDLLPPMWRFQFEGPGENCRMAAFAANFCGKRLDEARIEIGRLAGSKVVRQNHDRRS